MKALILTAGKGTRLKPITNTRAKHLIPIANKPILFYGLEQLREAGITDIGIVISPETGGQIKSALSDGQQWGVHLTYILQETPLGLAHAVKSARTFLADSNFILFLGDNIFKEGFQRTLRKFQSSTYDGLVVVKEVPDPRQFGVAEFDTTGNLARVVEKPQTPVSNLALVGVYIFTPLIHQAIDRIQPSRRGEYEITDAIQIMLDRGWKVGGHKLAGWWLDTGKKLDLLDANRIILDEYLKPDIESGINPNNTFNNLEKIEIMKGTVLENSTIYGPVSIAEGCRISDSCIGPFASIGPDVMIHNSTVSNSIIMSGSRLKNVGHLSNSVIGRQTCIEKRNDGGDSTELFLGDDDIVLV